MRLIAASGAIALLLAAGVAASAGESRSDGRAQHLLVVPSGAPLEETGARVVARYEGFTLVEAAGDDVQRLTRAGADVRDDMRQVTIDGDALDPARERRALTRKRGGPPRPGFAVVQFVGPVKESWLERLEKTGVRRVIYVAQNGYLVHGSAKDLERVAELVGVDHAVRAVVPYTAADKVQAGVRPSGRQRLAVQTLSGSDGAPGRTKVSGAGRPLRDITVVGPFRTQYVMADAAEARELASDPGVVTIAPSPAPELLDEAQDQILAGNTSGTDPLLPSGTGYLSFADGLVGTSTFPFAVDVTDEGIDAGVVGTTHPDLQVGGGGATRLDYVDDFTLDPDATDCGGHGTINAGIVGGFNNGTGPTVEDANNFNYGLGIAPRTRLGGSKIFRCSGSFSLVSSFSALTANAYSKGARISSNSWGCGSCASTYNADSQEYDKLVRDALPGTAGNQQMVELFAAGNDGSGGSTIGTPGNAKNVITVGASENVRASGTDGCGVTNSGADDAHDIIGFSSRGPAPGGRLKPDVVGPGTHIVGTKPQHGGYTGGGVCTSTFPTGSSLYSLSSGTSHSTPALSGVAALLRQWYMAGPGSGTPPSPALTKAILAQSGTDLVGGANGAGGTNTNVPNQIQGWGLANIQRALDSATPRYYRDQQDVLGATGQSFPRTFAVQDTSKPVRVTLAFTDAFGPTGTNPVVNDLNLTVSAGAGGFKGNVFSGGLSTTGGSADAVNTLESVYLPAGTSGNFSVEVTAANIAGDGVPGNADTTDQDFALTVANAAEVAAPALSHQSTSIGDQDGDGAVEPGETFTVSETVKNAGSAPATGVAGTLTGPGTVSITDGTAAWPNIGSGEAAANSDQLAGSLSAGAACGAPVQLSLAITTTEGSNATIPVELQTGNLGSPVARNAADLPQPIPDSPSPGMTSTLSVAESGTIADVDVRIGSLTHTWVGDLKLELTSPAGTTVVLANRPGGVNNSGDNFTNTVFDDEASAPIGTGAPYTGTFRPQSDQLSRFDGEAQNGTWSLKISDHAAPDAGTLNSWGHDIAPFACDAGGGSPPGAVAGLTATAGAEQVALNWDDTPSATAYEVYRKAGGVYPGTPDAAPSTSNFTDTERTAGVEDCYKVQATSSGGDGPMSGEVCATPTAPGSPPGEVIGLAATAGVEQVALDWADNPDASDYYVWRLNPDGSQPALPAATVTPSQHTDAGLQPAIQQCYKVQARNGVGTGPASAQVCATPQAASSGGGGTQPPVNQPPVLPKLDLSGIPGAVRVNAKGRFTLAFNATEDSAGSLTLTTVRAFATARRKKHHLASGAFTAAANGRATLKLKLGRKHFRLLKKKRKLKVMARARAGDLTSSKSFRLMAPKRRRT